MMWPVACFCEHGDGTWGSIERRGNTSQELLGILWCCCSVYSGLFEQWFWTPLKKVIWSIGGPGPWERRWPLQITFFSCYCGADRLLQCGSLTLWRRTCPQRKSRCWSSGTGSSSLSHFSASCFLQQIFASEWETCLSWLELRAQKYLISGPQWAKLSE